MRNRDQFSVRRSWTMIGLFCLIVGTVCGCGRTNDVGSSTNPSHSSSTLTAPTAETVTVELIPEAKPGAIFMVKGLPANMANQANAEESLDRFHVYLGAEVEPNQPAIVGECSFVKGGGLVFIPEFDLERGQDYTAVFTGVGTEPTIRRTFSIPSGDTTPETVVTHVYPSRDNLPQNLLKFYLHFSAPMRTGDSYEHIHLLGEDGTPIELPFLELNQELWDYDDTRMTLLFDPGRVKTGLKPHEDVGPPLLPGRRYTLVIDANWPDAQGKPLVTEFRKSFEVGEPDETQPSVEHWKIQPPAAGTTEPLEVRFEESLDRAMLDHILVVAANDQSVVGKIAVADQERTWRFSPDHAWQPGKFAVIVDSALEDLAGNSLARPFEVDLSGTSLPLSGDKTQVVPFEIAEPAEN